MTITWTFIPTYVGFQFLPYGGEVFLYPGAFNEFYSMTRFDSLNNYFVTFYWNRDNPPPFYIYSTNHAYLPIQVGEKFHVHRFITNKGNSGSSGNAGESKTKFQKIVKVQDGKIVEDDVKVPTDELSPGSYKLLSHEYTFQYNGYYHFEFQVDCDSVVIESNENNNYYIEEETVDIAGGGK